MRNLKTLCFCLNALLILSSPTWASNENLDVTASEVDLSIGETLYANYCSSCHGKSANGIVQLNAPNLAGQHQAYLLTQLKHFANGARGSNTSDINGQQMAVIAKSVGKTPLERAKAFRDISGYLSSLEKPTMLLSEQKTSSGNNPGYKAYQASCGACHGADASGNTRLNSPSLAGLSRDYLSLQYQHFLDGSRGSSDGDKYGRQMSMIANTLSEKKQIDAVIDYIVSLNEAASQDTAQ